MATVIDVDHPAVGAGHIFLAGSADSLVAAARLVATADWPAWVTIGREHRLPTLLERPITEAASEIWCLGYSGTGNPVLGPALDAHVTHRPVIWLSTTTGYLKLAASELPGILLESLPGGSLVNLVLRRRRGRWTPDDHASERLGFILGRYPSVRPTKGELTLANILHAVSVGVRNHEGRGPLLIKQLADTPVDKWRHLEVVGALRDEGEEAIRKGRDALRHSKVTYGGHKGGPALWVLPAGQIKRGVHGKALASEAFLRKAPVALVERTSRGYTKAWVVLPARADRLWVDIAETFGRYTLDFSWTGRRGAGAVHSDDVDQFAGLLWTAIRRR